METQTSSDLYVDVIEYAVKTTYELGGAIPIVPDTLYEDVTILRLRDCVNTYAFETAAMVVVAGFIVHPPQKSGTAPGNQLPGFPLGSTRMDIPADD